MRKTGTVFKGKKKTGLLKVLVIFAMASLAVMYQAAANDITIDGNINDWGLTQLQTNSWSDYSTWIPTMDNISFFIEDNQDPTKTDAVNNNPSYFGVHIIGNRTFQDQYTEQYLINKLNQKIAEPASGTDPSAEKREVYDFEAMYITENSTHIFVLIITSNPYVMGDLAMDFKPGGGYGYEYGLNFHSILDDRGYEYAIYATPTSDCWTIPTSYEQNRPAEINFSAVDENSALGFAKVAVADLGVSDHGRTNYAIEIGIPKDVVGNPDLPEKDPKATVRMFWITEYCGNDSGPSIPEFSSLIIPIGIIMGSIYILSRRE